MQQHLDRARPLWEMWVVEGLEDDRFALISKVHHCMIDGVSGVDLHERADDADARRARSPSRRPASRARRRRASSFSATSCCAARALPVRRRCATRATSCARRRTRARAGGARARASPRRSARRCAGARATPLNARDRPAPPLRLARDGRWPRSRRCARALGGSLNDVVLTHRDRRGARASSSAAASQLDGPRLPRDGAGERAQPRTSAAALGNRVSAWMIALPLASPTRAQQLERIAARTRGAQGVEAGRRRGGADAGRRLDARRRCSRSARATRRGSCPSTWSSRTCRGRRCRCTCSARACSRLPARAAHRPARPRHRAAQLRRQLCWGFNADYDLVPDLDDFVGVVQEAFEELREIARRARPAPKPTGPARRSRGGAARTAPPPEPAG